MPEPAASVKKLRQFVTNFPHPLNQKNMGTISKGILGGFSGTVGTVIGGSWKGIDYACVGLPR